LDTHLNCSECGKKISNILMTWEHKKMYWMWLLLIPVFLIPIIMMKISEENEYKPGVGLKAIVQKVTPENEEIIVLGKLVNSSEIQWKMVIVNVEFYNDKNEFIDECTRRLRVTVPPGEEENFKLVCDGLSKETIVNYNSYKIKVGDAGS